MVLVYYPNAQILKKNGKNDVASRVFGVRRRTGYLEKLQIFPHLLVKVPSQSGTSFPLQDSIEVEPSRFYSSAISRIPRKTLRSKRGVVWTFKIILALPAVA